MFAKSGVAIALAFRRESMSNQAQLSQGDRDVQSGLPICSRGGELR
jgi:hypothetical protein